MRTTLLTLPPPPTAGDGDPTHAPTNRVRATIQNRLYPLSERPTEGVEPELPAPLHLLPGLIEAGLPFHAEARAAATREALYDANERAYQVLERQHDESGQLVKDVFTAGVELRGGWLTDKRKHQYMQGMTETWNKRLPAFAFERPQDLTIDLHTRPDFVVRETLLHGIRQCIHTLVKKLALSLDCLTELEVVGLIEWLHPDACRYHFFRHVLEVTPADVRESSREEVTDRGPVRERKRTNRIERDTVEKRSVARHVHDLVCARNYALAGAKDVPVPDRVRELIEKTPLSLQPFLRVVTGKKVRHVIIERDLSTETVTDTEESVTVREEYLYQPDPALVLGHYVLAGWDEDELHPRTPTVFSAFRPLPASHSPIPQLPSGDRP